MLEGKGTIGVDGIDYKVKQGDIVYVSENVWHGPHVNTGNKPFRLLYVVSQTMAPSELDDACFKTEEEF